MCVEVIVCYISVVFLRHSVVARMSFTDWSHELAVTVVQPCRIIVVIISCVRCGP